MCIYIYIRRKHNIDTICANQFFKELQHEAFGHVDEVLGHVAGAAQRLWTSAKTMKCVVIMFIYMYMYVCVCMYIRAVSVCMHVCIYSCFLHKCIRMYIRCCEYPGRPGPEVCSIYVLRVYYTRA
jgi:hypothetical protein